VPAKAYPGTQCISLLNYSTEPREVSSKILNDRGGYDESALPEVHSPLIVERYMPLAGLAGSVH